MTMGRARSVVLIGMEGRLIEVEADIGQTLPAFVLLGPPDAALRESQDRIRSAAKTPDSTCHGGDSPSICFPRHCRSLDPVLT